MKVDAICRDTLGAEATVLVDLDYVNGESYEDIHQYCENELFEEHRHRFNILDFDVTNFKEILHLCVREQEDLACPIEAYFLNMPLQ